jgi:hypothetical protein
LCRVHHRAVHEGRFRIECTAGELMFIRPDGVRLDSVPASPAPGMARTNRSVERTDNDLVRSDLTPATSPPCWDGTPFDVDWAIDVLRGHGATRTILPAR